MSRTLAEAEAQLSNARYGIDRFVEAAGGAEYIDDIAAVALALRELMQAWGDNPAGWAVVSAHKALLIAAHAEGIIAASDVPPSSRDELAELPLTKGVLVMKREYDREVAELRDEIGELRRTIATLSETLHEEREQRKDVESALDRRSGTE